MNYTLAYRTLCAHGVSTTDARSAVDAAAEHGTGKTGKWTVTYSSRDGFFLEEK